MAGRAHTVVLGNEKGGSGKSTLAIHLIVALLRQGYRVASLDLDARQGTLSRYLDNRRATCDRRVVALVMPTHEALEPASGDDLSVARMDEQERFQDTVERLAADHDYLVCDTPGGATHLSALGHARADTLITPLNDSFLDLDVLAAVDGDSLEILRPSHYAAMVWERKKERALVRHRAMDWIVLRNRLSNLDAVNKRNMADVLDRLGARIGFRVLAGFGERVIFRELFLAGLTLLDLREQGTEVPFTLSHVAARHELRSLLEAIGIGAPAARVVEGARRRA